MESGLQLSTWDIVFLILTIWGSLNISNAGALKY